MASGMVEPRSEFRALVCSWSIPDRPGSGGDPPPACLTKTWTVRLIYGGAERPALPLHSLLDGVDIFFVRGCHEPGWGFKGRSRVATRKEPPGRVALERACVRL